MPKKRNHNHMAEPKKQGFMLRDIILGGQDGLVNVLGLVLGVAGATLSTKVILVSGLAATFAESISMAAVAYTSSKAALSYYKKMVHQEKEEMASIPAKEMNEIQKIYYKKGFRGQMLSKIVSKITSSKRIWLNTMTSEELRLFPEGYSNPLKNAFVVGMASLVGSVLPLIPFIFLSPVSGIYAAFFMAVVVLFCTGAVKARLTIGDWKKSGFEMALIGTVAALAGYLIGIALGRIFGTKPV